MSSFLLNNWHLILVALASGGFLLWPTIKGSAGGGASVGTAEAVRLVNREKAVLIDVSEPAEYAVGHVGGARNVPFGQLGAADNKALPRQQGAARGAGLPDRRTRHSRAVALLKKAGYENVKTLSGGLSAWREANLPVEKSAA